MGIARRAFLIGSAAVAGGLAVGFYSFRRPYDNPLLNDTAAGDTVFNPYVKIGPDNKITVIVPRAEMGQGVRTTLAALVAEELNIDLAEVHVEHGPASWAYYNAAGLADGGPFAKFNTGFAAEAARDMFAATGKMLGLQMTGGSSSTTDAFTKMREAGAVTRVLLLQAASSMLEQPVGALEAKDGRISGQGKSITYGEVAAKAAQLTPPSSVELKKPSEWRLLGKPQERTDIPAKVTGQAKFGIED